MISNGLSSGYHEFSFKILKCDVDLQEVGVIGCANIKGIAMDDDGAGETRQFGARSVYGNEMASDSSFYASWDEDGKKRCFRDLRYDLI